MLNRGFVGLAQLLPGGGPARTGDGRFGINTAFGGTNVRSMYSMQIDGGIMDHPIYGFAIVNVSQDAVQEFRVLRNQFDAEYSRAGTAFVNVVTRSGTNNLHGQASYFGRDDNLNAKNAFAVTKPPFDSTRVSGTIGGPIHPQQGVLLRSARVQPRRIRCGSSRCRRPTLSRRITTAFTPTAIARSSDRRRWITRSTRSTPSTALSLRE